MSCGQVIASAAEHESALIERTIVKIYPDRVMIREIWALDHPDCPFVVCNGMPYFGENVMMTLQEYRERFGRPPTASCAAAEKLAG
jgi:hypothetical protein